MDAVLESMGRETYVSLTTFRKTGVGVATPIWIANDGDALLATTTSVTGKVKRIRNNPVVELRPCSRSGAVAPDTPVATARAEVLTDPDSRARITRYFAAKYGIPFRLFGLIQKVRRTDLSKRVVLRFTDIDTDTDA